MSGTTATHGGLLIEVPGGLVFRSRFQVEHKACWGPDADLTTLVVDLLEAAAEHGLVARLDGVPGGVDADVLTAALPWLVLEGGPHRLQVLDHAVALMEDGLEASPLEPLLEADCIQLDPSNHADLAAAWSKECSDVNVSQGAYVSDRSHRLAAPARLGLLAQDGPVWPPRGSTHEGLSPSAGPHLAPWGAVHSWTRLLAAGAPSEFALRAPLLGDLTSMVVDLDDGPRGVFLHADGHPASVAIGDRVRLVVRRLYAQDGVLRYGRKALHSP